MSAKAHRVNIGTEANLPATWPDNDTLFITEKAIYKSTSTDETEQPLQLVYELALMNDAVLLRNTASATISNSCSITKAMEGKLHNVESFSDVTITIPADIEDVDVDFEIGASIAFTKENAGNIIIAADDGVTMKAAAFRYILSTQFEIIHIRKKSANEWRVYGGDL